MIRRVADSVQICYKCEQQEKEFVYSMRIQYGRKALRTLPKPIPQDTDERRELVVSWAEALATFDAVRATRPLAFKTAYDPSVPGACSERIRLERQFDSLVSAASTECRLKTSRATEALERQVKLIPLETPLIVECDGRYYALHQLTLWSSTRSFTNDQWLGLISQAMNREEAKLASLVAADTATTSRRLALPASVRIEVSRRDGRGCVRCGSREHFEFDQIIPVALGGSSTGRNIELLYESCNRFKSASIA